MRRGCPESLFRKRPQIETFSQQTLHTLTAPKQLYRTLLTPSKERRESGDSRESAARLVRDRKSPTKKLRNLANSHSASKCLAPTRSRSPITPTPYQHDNITSGSTPSPASYPKSFSAFRIAFTGWIYLSVQLQLGVQGWICLMTRSLWLLEDGLEGNGIGHYFVEL